MGLRQLAGRILSRALDTLADFLVGAFRLEGGSQWSARVSERVSHNIIRITDDAEYIFAIDNTLLLWRAKTLFSKEPETIRWIRGFGAEDVFFDIGANVGSYTVYAGKRCRRVIAFEPEAQNFAVLNRNIALNKLQDKVVAFPFALSDERKLDTLRLNTLNAGAALHAFGTNIDFKGEHFESAFEQGSISLTLDELALSCGLDFPNFIKIDVDGLESRIINGGKQVLRDTRLRGLLLELNESSADDMSLIALLKSCGLSVSARGDAVIDPRGRFSMRNFIFSRDAG